MANVIASISHPYWTNLGRAVHDQRARLGLSQLHVAIAVGLSVRNFAYLEHGFVPTDAADALGRVDLKTLDEVLQWEEGTSRKHVTEAVAAANTPGPFTSPNSGPGFDRSTYTRGGWIRLGVAVQMARMALRMTKPALAYATQSSSKTMLRLEKGCVYGDPRTAPPGDYNSEKYWIKRLALLEMALEWEEGQARQILDGTATK